jgi:hypothetical protein
MRTKQQGTDTNLERKTRTEAGKTVDDLKREPMQNTETGLSLAKFGENPIRFALLGLLDRTSGRALLRPVRMSQRKTGQSYRV